MRGLAKFLASQTEYSLSESLEKPQVKMVWESPSQASLEGRAPSWTGTELQAVSFLGSKKESVLSLVIVAKREPF